jgi:hypothetical protein
MKLADLRRLAIRKQIAIRFRLSNGMECVVTGRGIATVPGLDRIPGFNLEQELESAADFLLEPAGGRERAAQRVTREELSAMASASRAAGAAAREEE